MSIHSRWIKISNHPAKAVTVIFMGMFCFLLLLYSVYDHRDVINDRLLLASEQSAKVEIQKRFISKGFESIVSDMIYLQRSPVFLQFVNEGKGKSIVENEWIAFSESKKKYDQIRYLDVLGNERIRVNFNKGNSSKVDDKDLQNKGKRYYFQETLKLNQGQIYISKFDLNVEKDQLELPIKPMIRFGLPIFDQAKTKQGVIIVNYFGNSIIGEMKKATQENREPIQLLNEDSYWLVGPDSSREWAFMYPDREKQNFKNKFPQEWSRVLEEQKGQFFTSNGLFTFSVVDAPHELESLLVGMENGHMVCESNHGVWFIISRVPASANEYANDKNSYVVSAGKVFGSPLLIFTLVTISLLVAIVLVFYISSNEKMKILATYDGLSGCLNRASGIAMMENLVKENNDLTVCFIDINGLKEVNDFLGHGSGDDLILTSVKVMQESIREIDLLIRLGGDEFLICFPNTALQQAEIIWQRLVEKIQKVNKEGNKKFIISLSHGISILNKTHDHTLDSVIKEADLKMYAEKKNIKGVGFSVLKR